MAVDHRVVDVLVIGAGPAGLTAAAAAAERGRRVVVVDQALRSGGQIWRHRSGTDLTPRARRALARVSHAGVEFVSRATVIDMPSSGEALLDIDGAATIIRCTALILATGATERFLPFPGWTLPGVTGVGGLQALIKNGLALRGARVVIAGTGPLLFPVAAAVARCGADLRLVGEQASRVRLLRFGLHLANKPHAIAQAVLYRRGFRTAPYRTAAWITAAHGDERLRAVTVRRGDTETEYDCDWLACSAGLCPRTDVAQLLDCAIVDDAIVVDATQQTSVAGVWAAGECTGVKGDAAAMVEGEIAGRAAAGDIAAAHAGALQRKRRRGRAFAAAMATAFAPRRELRQLADATTVLCRCEDVRCGAIDPAWTQRQAKLWTRLGMGACQGAVCGPLCESLFGWQRNAVRPPLGAARSGTWYDGLTAQSVEDIRSSAAAIER